jgi:hypothetical protein
MNKDIKMNSTSNKSDKDIETNKKKNPPFVAYGLIDIYQYFE